MAYISYSFVFFVLIFVCIYYAVPKRYQWLVLLAASILFYCCSGPVFLVYLVTISFLTWYGAKCIAQYEHKENNARGACRALLAIICFLNIGVLLIMKWSGIELALLNRLFGTSLSIRILLPLGISFFSFQNVSYIVDVYRGTVLAEQNFGYYLLYSSYFPYIVSGPINRYGQMKQQFFSPHFFRKDTFYQGMLRIMFGAAKKMVIADRAAIFVDQIFDHYYMYRGLFIVIAVILFSIQLYMDFSGCMDIVIGVSQLFGITMNRNFNAPYGAVTTAEFWRKWHISLTSWFRDYIYIPLGGNQKGKFFKYLNIMVVFLFCGIWHGAGITFLVWGFLNGLYQVIGDMTVEIREKICRFLELDEVSYGARLRKRFITVCLIEFAWLFFRANGIGEAFEMIKRLFTGWNPWILTDGTLYQVGLDIWDFLIIIAGSVCIGWISSVNCKKDLHQVFLRQSWLFRSLLILLMLVIWYLFGIYGPEFDAAEFIYYNF